MIFVCLIKSRANHNYQRNKDIEDVRLTKIEESSIVNDEPIVIMTDEEGSSSDNDYRAMDL